MRHSSLYWPPSASQPPKRSFQRAPRRLCTTHAAYELISHLLIVVYRLIGYYTCFKITHEFAPFIFDFEHPSLFSFFSRKYVQILLASYKVTEKSHGNFKTIGIFFHSSKPTLVSLLYENEYNKVILYTVWRTYRVFDIFQKLRLATYQLEPKIICLS